MSAVALLGMQFAGPVAKADPDCDAIRAPFQTQFHRDWVVASSSLYLQKAELEDKFKDFAARYLRLHPASATSPGETRRVQLSNIRGFLEQNSLILSADEQQDSTGPLCTVDEAGSTAFLSTCKTNQWHDDPTIQIMSADRDGKRVVEICSTVASATEVQFENVLTTQCIKSDDFPSQPLRASSIQAYVSLAGNNNPVSLRGIEQDQVVDYYAAHSVPQRCMSCPVPGEERQATGTSVTGFLHPGAPSAIGSADTGTATVGAGSASQR